MENEFVKVYMKFFPGVIPTMFQAELIISTVTDSDAWRKTLTFWAGNCFRAQSVFKMLEYYKEQTKKQVGQSFDNEPEPSCKKCMDFGYNLVFPDPTKPMEMVKEDCDCRTRPGANQETQTATLQERI